MRVVDELESMNELVGGDSDRRPLRPPSMVNTALELRVPFEWASMRVASPVMRRFPRGDGHSVLFLPGFTATDASTRQMRALFQHLGYRTYRWRLGRNKGPTERIAPRLLTLAERVIERADGPISIVGWSLGGLFARELARRYPDNMRQIITLGSPVNLAGDDRTRASELWDRVKPRHVDFLRLDVPPADRPALPAPTTSIFTRSDGVVYWKSCVIPRSETTENVEVWGTHSGLAFNPSVMYVIADRLAQPADTWRHFSVPWFARASFPCQRA